MMARLSLSLLLAVTGSALAAGTRAESAPVQQQEATRSQGRAEWGFFAITDAGGALQGLKGVRWSRITGLVWPKLEVPIGSGRYSWQGMDEHVRDAGKSGYNLVFVLKTGNDPNVSEQACVNALSRSGNRDSYLVSCPPKAEYEAAWKKLVQAIIERYDGDGRDDMPGLTRGFVVDVQVENESGSPSYWSPDHEGDGRGAVEPYLRLLRLAQEARAAANPATRIIATGFIQPEILAECSSGRGNACSTPFYTRNRDFTLEVLKHPELFDAIDVHMFSYYRFSAGRVEAALQWFHDRMKSNGYAKPIYSLEWTGAMLKDLKVHAQEGEFLAYFPFRNELPNRQRMQETYQDLSNLKNKKYRDWFDAEQAKEFPKLFTVLLAAGVERLIHVQFHDYVGFGWKNTWWNWQGIVRYAGTRDRPVAIRKPAYYAYQLLSEKIADFTSVESVDVGADATAYRYRFANRNPVFIAWARGDRAQLPLAKLGATRVRLTPFVTALDATDRPVQAPAETSSDGRVPLTDTPMVVERP